MACREPAIDESPQILNMRIEGISQENISIDQQQRRITVLLPSTLPALELFPSFTLSKQTHLAPYWTEGKKVISLIGYCPGNYWNGFDWTSKSPEGLEITTVVSNQKQSISYTIQFKSIGPLRLKTIPTPLVYDLNGPPELVVPVENYYGSSFVEYIAVTKTGSISPFWIGPGGGRLENCASLLNKLSIPLAGYIGSIALKPGLHDLDLWLADGTKVHATGYILVK